MFFNRCLFPAGPFVNMHAPLLRIIDLVVTSTRSICWIQEGQGGAVGMAQSVERLPCKPEDLSLI